MAHPDQPYWLWAGGIASGLGMALVGVAGARDSSGASASFWGSPTMIVAYLVIALALIFFFCALREVQFPLAIHKSRSQKIKQSYWIDSPDGKEDANRMHQEPRAGSSSPTFNSRIFVEESPKGLTAMFKRHTSAQARKLLEPYYDQWLVVDGELRDVGEWTGTFSQVVFKGSFRHPAIFMRFTDRSVFTSRLSVLRRGTRVTVIGQIEDINASSITITNCELQVIHS
jgi:hypothetical protein